MSRRPILAANWKMNLLRADAAAFCDALGTADARRLTDEAVEAVIFPSFPLLDTVASGVGDSAVAVGGQDLHTAAAGAHTGDVSAAQLVDAGCKWVLCGHSERRRDHGEDDALVAQKAQVAHAAEMVPLICIGETRDERQAGKTFEVLERQVKAAVQDLARFELAYEPVWAIGTGETATPAMAQEAHAFIRGLLGRLVGGPRAAKVRILYGGSAKPENVESLYAEADIDGFLVGGASLDSEKFLTMIRSCARFEP